MSGLIYKVKDLRAVAAYFRGNKRFGRTTKLVHVPTGTVMFEAMGVVRKGDLYTAYLRYACERNAAATN